METVKVMFDDVKVDAPIKVPRELAKHREMDELLGLSICFLYK